MASLNFEEKNSRYRIRFTAPDESIRCISLKQGKKESRKGLDKRASSLVHQIEYLIETKASGRALDDAQRRWIDTLKPSYRKTLTDCGLLDPDSGEPKEPSAMLIAFCESWVDDRSKDKQSTQLVRGRAMKHLKAFFAADIALVAVTEYDAECYSRFLRQTQQLSESTARKMVSIAKQMLRSAVKARLLLQNPFDEEKTTPPAKADSKQYHVSDAEIQIIYKACPTTEWKTFLVLGRYAGLRLPSEIKQLRWKDINWKANVFTVNSPKLEHLTNGGIRQVPLFPQVKLVLAKLWAENPGEFVLPHIRTIQNPNPVLRKIIEKTSVKPWPDLIYNLRQSAINDAEHNPRFTTKNVSDWFGNSEKTRQKHYSRTLASDIEAAADTDGSDLEWMDNSDSVQILSTKASETGGTECSAHKKTPGISGVFSSLPVCTDQTDGPNWT